MKKQAILDEAKKLTWASDFGVVEKFLKPYIRVSGNSNIPLAQVGQSKLGGSPHLPKNIDWPKFQGEYMAFLGQLNIADFKVLDVEDILPQKGLLYYFMYLKVSDGQYDITIEKNSYKVLYCTEEELEIRDYPAELPEMYQFGEQALEFDLRYSLPVHESLEIQNFSDEDIDNLWNFNNQFGSGEGTQILGYCSPIQYDVTWDWAFSDLEIDPYDLSESNLAKIDALRPEFINLLQFSLDNEITGFNKMGDAIGYFGIKKRDLEDKNFDKVVLVFQNT